MGTEADERAAPGLPADAGELRRLVDVAPVAIAMLDRDMRYLASSRRWRADYRLGPEPLVGRSHYEVFPEIPERWREIHRRCLAGAVEASEGEAFRRADGAVQWVSWEIQPWRDEAGEVGGLVIVSEDIAARREAEEALRDSHAALRSDARELRARAEQLQRLASDLTLAEQRAREELAKTLHDGLQQLLFSAALSLDRLRSRLADAPAGADDLLRRARADLDAAIAAARSLSVELYPPVLLKGDLAAALEWLAEWCGETYGMAVEVSARPDTDPGRSDVRALLFESVRELLFNAVKHAGVESAAIGLSHTPAGAVRIEVSDAGAGFDPPAVLDGARGPATGLGLVGIRERVSLLGGAFEVASAPGRGTRVTIEVPLEPPPAGPAGRPGPGGRTPLRVVIADDHALVREGLAQLIDEQPDLIVVGFAADGVEALAATRELRPDVVIMDVAMPRMDGVEATRRIRDEAPGVRVYGISTQERSRGLHAIERAGASGYFAKGADSSDLIDTLRALYADAAPP